MNSHEQAIHNKAILADRGEPGTPGWGRLPPRGQRSETLLSGGQSTIMSDCDLCRRRPLKALHDTSFYDTSSVI